MTITVGTDTYVSVADASAYLALHYISTDAQLIAWTALGDTDKEIYLRNATLAIDRLRFPGFKSVTDQDLAFPRDAIPAVPLRREARPWYYDYFSLDWWTTSTVPDEVKFAQIEEALELTSPGSATGIKNRTQDGIQSFREGDYQETRTSGGGASSIPLLVRQTLNSIKAQEFISVYTGGSFRIV